MSPFPPPFAYTGRYLDPDTGLQWNGERWYSPSLGRFVSKDPIGFNGGEMNLYEYANNSPENGTDPTGLEPTASGGPFNWERQPPGPLPGQSGWHDPYNYPAPTRFYPDPAQRPGGGYVDPSDNPFGPPKRPAPSGTCPLPQTNYPAPVPLYPSQGQRPGGGYPSGPEFSNNPPRGPGRPGNNPYNYPAPVSPYPDRGQRPGGGYPDPREYPKKSP